MSEGEQGPANSTGGPGLSPTLVFLDVPGL